MISAYSVVEEDEISTTYEYSTICTYWLYGSAAIWMAGYLMENQWVWMPGLVLIIGYIAVVLIPAARQAKQINASIKSQAAEISGSRWSFSKPLRIKVQKENAA